VKRLNLIRFRILAYILFVFLGAALSPCSRLVALAPAPPIAWSITTADTFWPDVAPAPGGGVYVATADSTSTGALIRLDALGNQLWRQTAPAGRPMTTVASDAAGNALLGGYRPSFPNDGYLLKYSPAGTLQWTQTISSPLSDWPTGIGVDPSGNAYFADNPWTTNYGIPPAGTYSNLRRFNPDGQLAWLLNLNTQDGTYPGNGGHESNGTVVDHGGHVYSMFNNYSFDSNHVSLANAYLSKSTLDGQLLWIKPLGGLANIFSVAVDSNDNVYAAAGGLQKFDSDGNLLWSRSDGPANMFSVAIGASDQVFVAGHSDLAPYIAQFDVNGNLQWRDIQPVAQNEWINYSGLTVSGNTVVGSAWVSRDGFTQANIIRAYQLIPEPSSLMLVAGLLVFGPVFGRRTRS
jgi:hypothetical protein